MRSRLIIIVTILIGCTSANSASWYLDNAAAGANNGTSWANAWTSPSNIVWSSINAGDTVFISGGTSTKVYTGAGARLDIDTYRLLRCSRAGAPGNPITITVGRDPGHTGRVIFDYQNRGNRADVVSLSSYNILDGGPNTNIWIINNTNQMNKDWGTGVQGGGSSNVKITRVGISNVNNGITFVGGTGQEISSNQVRYIIGDVAISLNGQIEAWDQIRVHHNWVQCISDWSFRSGADGIKPGRGASIYNNELRNDVGQGFPRDGQHADAFQTAGYINFSKYYNNRVHAFYNSCFEFGVERNTRSVMIYNNVTTYDNTAIAGASHNIMEWASEGWKIESIKDVYIFNNTFVDHSGGNVWLGISWDKNRGPNGEYLYFPTVTNLVIRNNLFYNVSRIDTPVVRLGDYPNPKWNPYDPSNLLMSHNLLYPGAAGGYIIQVGTNYHNGIFYNQSNPILGQPRFASYVMNSPANDYRLLTNSAGVASGANLTSMLTALGVAATDMEGTPRPSSGAWTVGALENLQSGGAASIFVGPATQDFGTVMLGQSMDKTFIVSNSAVGTLSGTATVQPPFAVVSGETYTLGAGQGQTVTVRYTPVSAGTHSQTLAFSGAGGATAVVQGLGYQDPNTPPSTDLTRQSTSAVITAPLSLSNGSISQGVQTDSPTDGGRASYSFTLSNSGRFALLAVVKAPGDANNSYFVNIDAEPQSPSMIWDIPVAVDFQRRLVSWRGNGTSETNQFSPKVFDLSAGAHQIIVRGRESNVQLESLTVVPLPLAPQDLQRIAEN